MQVKEDIATAQNKGKKGIRALFKKKREKEIIAEARVIDRKNNTIQILNKYETGRLEIVELSQKKFKTKVFRRNDVEPQDIGNNGGLILNNPIVDRVDVRYDITNYRNFNIDSRVDVHEEYEK